MVVEPVHSCASRHDRRARKSVRLRHFLPQLRVAQNRPLIAYSPQSSATSAASRRASAPSRIGSRMDWVEVESGSGRVLQKVLRLFHSCLEPTCQRFALSNRTSRITCELAGCFLEAL